MSRGGGRRYGARVAVRQPARQCAMLSQPHKQGEGRGGREQGLRFSTPPRVLEMIECQSGREVASSSSLCASRCACTAAHAAASADSCASAHAQAKSFSSHLSVRSGPRCPNVAESACGAGSDGSSMDSVQGFVSLPGAACNTAACIGHGVGGCGSHLAALAPMHGTPSESLSKTLKP